MKVLYIGGTGEISYQCALRDVELGREVAVFNRARRGEPLPPNVRQITGDLNDQAAYAALGREDWDVVCQFLAFELPRARADADIFAGRCGQYVFISSTSAYRKPPQGYVITEDVGLGNRYWPYSQAKADMESYLWAQHASGRLAVTIVRPSHTLRSRFPGGITTGDDWAWRMLNDKPVIVQGDGSSLWTLTHSADFAAVFCNLLGNPAAIGEAFHITRHMEAFTWDDIFRAVGRAVGKAPRIVHVPTDTLVRYRADWAGPLLGDKAWSVMFDNSKVMRVAGKFTCRFGLEETMEMAAEHWRKRADGYRDDPARTALLDRIAAEQSALGA